MKMKPEYKKKIYKNYKIGKSDYCFVMLFSVSSEFFCLHYCTADCLCNHCIAVK